MADLILNQGEIPKAQWRYGLSSSARTGCGWIAVYNALVLLGEDPEPEALIRSLERQLPLLQGTFGTLCLGPAILLKKMGYPVFTTSDVSRFDALCKTGNAAILFYYWRKGLKLGAHFTALRWDGTHFVGCNTYKNSRGLDDYSDSLPAFLKREGYFGAVLTVVKKNGH